MSEVMTARGFPISVAEHDVPYFYQLVNGVYDQYFVSMTLTNRQKLDAIDELRAVWGGNFPQYTTLGSWFLKLLENDAERLDDIQLMLIEDTILYLKTGTRRLPLATYRKILPYLGERKNVVGPMVTLDAHQHVNRQKRIKDLIHVIRDTESEQSLYVRWTRTEDRFMDMIAFLRIILEPQPTF